MNFIFEINEVSYEYSVARKNNNVVEFTTITPLSSEGKVISACMHNGKVTLYAEYKFLIGENPININEPFYNNLVSEATIILADDN